MSGLVNGAWPYPFWIAHRGAGKLAPENTLVAFERGRAHGYCMFECDVKLSADEQAFLLHDKDLHRTTNYAQAFAPGSDAMAASHDWASLSRLDAGGWLSPFFAGEPLPLLQTVARWCRQHKLMLNIEIKPTPGMGARTGQVVAEQAAELWRGAAVAPLLTSFDVHALEAARQAQPELPRGLLLDRLYASWLDTAQALACVAVVLDHALWTADVMAAAKSASLRCLAYTVNQPDEADRLRALGIDGIITDRVDLFKPDAVSSGNDHTLSP